jgi:hypothetical protein
VDGPPPDETAEGGVAPDATGRTESVEPAGA